MYSSNVVTVFIDRMTTRLHAFKPYYFMMQLAKQKNHLISSERDLGLGFLDKMRKYPSLFDELFVFQESSPSVSKLLGAINIPGRMDECERQDAIFLKHFTLESSLDTLRKFLTFATGRPCLASFGLQKMDLKFADGESGSIFCLNMFM